MDALPAQKHTRSLSSSWLRSVRPSRGATRLGLRLRTPRPVISAPIGPIKNSRGPNFSRSESLIIVDAISDCMSPSKVDKPRTISASSPIEPLPSRPTVAKPTVTASKTFQAPLRKKSVSQLHSVSLSASSKLPPPFLKTSSTTALLSRVDSVEQHENTLPETDIPKSKAAPQSKLPKSRTMSVLHGLKSSISKPSLNARRYTTHGPYDSTPSSFLSTVIPPSSSRARLQGTSQTSLTNFLRPRSPEPHPWHIRDAQPSAYWSGRFMSLYDKFSAEVFIPIPMSSRPSTPQNDPDGSASSPTLPRSKPLHHTQLRLSTTTPAFTRAACTPMTVPGVTEENETIRRVFRHLGALCATDEARASLADWQQAYTNHRTRQHRRPPVQVTSGRGIVSRFFSSTEKTGRRRLATVREPSTPHAEKRLAAEHMVGARRPRATMF